MSFIKIIEQFNLNNINIKARIGIHSGPVMAGIIGAKKFSYDIWGHVVNITSRIEGFAPSGWYYCFGICI